MALGVTSYHFSECELLIPLLPLHPPKAKFKQPENEEEVKK